MKSSSTDHFGALLELRLYIMRMNRNKQIGVVVNLYQTRFNLWHTYISFFYYYFYASPLSATLPPLLSKSIYPEAMDACFSRLQT
jgi:hypothetical protein